MNWLDILIILIVAAGALIGMRTGLIGAAFSAVGVLIGWMVASWLSDDIGDLIGSSLSGDRWVTVISYAIIIVLAVVVTRMAWRIARPLLSVATMGLAGMTDRLGGLALGLVLGVAISGALIIAMARLAYNFELPEEGIAGRVVERIPDVEETEQRIEGALVASSIVPVFVDLTDALSGNALGFVPSDFKASLDILEQKIDEEDSS